ncbi:hypothetical protein AMTRI_Chr01g127120 [Amborella trichopoda]|uniref:F-box domain-containing protein n=1 Tax=Amborella trichopoda TaxID=13333 RepID=W1NWJ1_AMBTC|nr:F-box protein At4g18380 [Amborella trichopoda]XP_020518545.1 F-box protein At4g18380 [Amborella trichopoda]ERM99054.1 hypothetical protein AMTR_s00101p00078790 [Amborella trichopoda]|eukprot:XP_006836201.1 F-box protein At4g18380 [Amborella trichopoda]
MQTKPRISPSYPIPEDHFDRLPDSLLLIIFNKLEDVKSLGRCFAVSKRFNSLIPEVHNVLVKFDCVISGTDDDDPNSSILPRPRNLFSHFFKLMLGAFLKPFHSLRTNNNKPLFPQLAHHSPAQVLRNFHHVHHLRIVLPTGDLGTDDGVLLKWKAEFGSTLHSCVILGGTKMEKKPVSDHEPLDDNGSFPESFYTNGGLKLRVVWTISSLIAASARHYFLQQIIREHPTLKSLVLTDADGQGTLSMGIEQLREFREKPLAASAGSSRTQVPALNMKLRYAPYLELPDGMGMQGATLVAIKPSGELGSGGNSKREAEAFVCGAFDGPFKAAVKALVKRRTYLLEMNSF